MENAEQTLWALEAGRKLGPFSECSLPLWRINHARVKFCECDSPTLWLKVACSIYGGMFW